MRISWKLTYKNKLVHKRWSIVAVVWWGDILLVPLHGQLNLEVSGLFPWSIKRLDAARLAKALSLEDFQPSTLKHVPTTRRKGKEMIKQLQPQPHLVTKTSSAADCRYRTWPPFFLFLFPPTRFQYATNLTNSARFDCLPFYRGLHSAWCAGGRGCTKEKQRVAERTSTSSAPLLRETERRLTDADRQRRLGIAIRVNWWCPGTKPLSRCRVTLWNQVHGCFQVWVYIVEDVIASNMLFIS